MTTVTELWDGVLRRAEAEGLVDVAWVVHDSPVGPLVLAATDDGLVTLSYQDVDYDQLHQVEAVGLEVLGEAGVRHDFVFGHGQHVHRAFAEPTEQLFVHVVLLLGWSDAG